jgi:hypothetical protein
MANADIRPMVDAIVTDRLGLPLDEWISDRRDEGTSWQDVAALLSEVTDGVVAVSWTTLRRWSEKESA